MLMMLTDSQWDGRSLLIGAKVTAELAGCSTRTLYRWVERKEFPQPVRTDGHWLWSRADVELWVQVNCSMSRYRTAKRKS